ncbi:HEAT repeat-containing protein 3-like isoform X2 [Sinocyclocheilus anshuiensis]|uniref:HEAT repeat-containing protein 3-like isoform X2 n=1 Tax=Sinocyclocheilus anshuiensis TaxID=1608454 RepID=UPI0007B798F2|nr:PREDICTED: HEAT repeat-containing protein 3-like isoform X2 [Sinocyclocheilus anshuiensis]
MGKTKNNKFKRPSFSPDGLPATPVKQTGDESEDEDSPAEELLDKSQTIPGFLQRDAVRKIGPLLLDRSLAVRETAAGALRNLSACGGPEVCEDMVRQDVLTPLSALLRECCTGFDMSSSPTMKGQKRTVEDVANEAVNLLWNLCESSSTAVSVFNKAGLLDVLLHCLQRHPQNMELAISAAHCMHTVTEENEELVHSVNAAVFGVLENILSTTHTSMEYTLLRTLAAGSLWNLKSGLSSAQQSQTLTALATTLSHSLSLDAGELIPELWRAESARLSKETTSATESDHTDARPAGHEAEEMEEDVRDEKMNGRKPNERMSKTKNDISDLLPRDRLELREAKALLSAQQTSLEIIVNMCCSDEPSDDEWEEMSSSDESEVCADGMSDTNSSLFSPLCLSAELHKILLNHSIPQQILKKAEFPSAVALELCSKYPTWKCLLKKMHRVQCRALTCLHNILSSMDTESLGGASGLQAVAQHLSSLVFSSAEALKDEEFLEAVTSALRSLLQIMATKNIPQGMTPHQLMIFCEAATSCELVSVRVNALAILGITGSSLSKEKNTADTLQLIGNALLNIAMKDSNLVVCGEALDALFDVFADGDEAEKAGKNINLLSSLKALQPGFRAKLRKEGRGKYSPCQLCVLDNIRINLKRFLSYLENLQRK